MSLERWSIKNFSALIHTQTRKLQKGEVYLADVSNLRLGPDGELVTRFGHTVEGEIASGDVTGIVVFERAADPFVLILNDLGELRIAIISSGSITSISAPLVTNANLSGRLSGVLLTDDIIIFTSEGTDRGYWIDLSNYTPTAVAYPLGFDIPDVTAVVLADIGATGFLDQNAFYYYRITYFRNTDPFNNKESVSSTILNLQTTASGADDREVGLSVLPTVTLAATGITSMRIWRSEGQVASVADPTTLDYYLVVTIPNSTASYDDTMADATLTGQTAFDAVGNLDYDVPPNNIKSVELHNGRIWLAGYGSAIRYSLIQTGSSLYWAFPVENEILSHRGRIHAVTEYREMLIALGAAGHGRLTGLSEEDFSFDWLKGSVGVIDGFSWAHGNQLLWYIASSGFYAFDGVQSVKINSPVEQLFAEQAQKPIITGSVFYLPTNEMVFDVFHVLNNESTTIVYDFDDQTWRKVSCGRIAQAISAQVLGVLQVFYAWDSTAFIRRWWHGYEINTLLNPIPTQDETDAIPTLADISWLVKSQKLHFGNRMTMKIAAWSEIQVLNSTALTLDVWADGVNIVNQALTVPGTPDDPYEFPAEGFGVDLEMQLSGSGVVDLRHMGLIADV